MKVIFLDIDGVLNTHNYFMKQVENNNGKINSDFQLNFCPESLINLKKIVESTDAKIVISSTWRGSADVSYHSPIRKYWKAIIKNLGSVGLHNKIIGTTPLLEEPSIRGREITEWLKNNKVDNFVILDDDDDMGTLKDHLSQCGLEGITENVREKAIKILNGK